VGRGERNVGCSHFSWKATKANQKVPRGRVPKKNALAWPAGSEDLKREKAERGDTRGKEKRSGGGKRAGPRTVPTQPVASFFRGNES